MSDTPAPRYQVGDEVYGFSFAQAKKCQGEIVAINPYTVYGYVLDNGDELGPYDDIGTMESKKRMDEALERFHNEEQNEVTGDGRSEVAHMPSAEQLNEAIRNWKPVIMVESQVLTEDRVRKIVSEMFEQMIEVAAQRISEQVKQMIETMDEDEDESEPASRVIQYDGPGSVAIEFEYEGKRYQGTAHEVGK